MWTYITYTFLLFPSRPEQQIKFVIEWHIEVVKQTNLPVTFDIKPWNYADIIKIEIKRFVFVK